MSNLQASRPTNPDSAQQSIIINKRLTFLILFLVPYKYFSLYLFEEKRKICQKLADNWEKFQSEMEKNRKRKQQNHLNDQVYLDGFQNSIAFLFQLKAENNDHLL